MGAMVVRDRGSVDPLRCVFQRPPSTSRRRSLLLTSTVTRTPAANVMSGSTSRVTTSKTAMDCSGMLPAILKAFDVRVLDGELCGRYLDEPFDRRLSNVRGIARTLSTILTQAVDDENQL